jgi:hypothetical protein
MWPDLYANLALLEKSPNYLDKRNAQSVLQDHRPQLVHMNARPALLEVTLPLQDPRVNYVQRTLTRMSPEQKFALFAHQGLHHLVHQRAYTYSVCTYICSRMNTPASASLIRTTIECVIDSFYGSSISFKQCSAQINRILLLLFFLLSFLLSVCLCRLPFFSFLFPCLSRPYRTDLPACVLVVSRFVTTDFRTTVNTCMLQSRGGARSSKPLCHRFLIERKQSNVSSPATPRPYFLIDRSATWSVCRPVVVDYIVSFASSLFA